MIVFVFVHICYVRMYMCIYKCLHIPIAAKRSRARACVCVCVCVCASVLTAVLIQREAAV
jgi:hypothetical protein